jgi:HAMP domain-containing protein
MKFYNRIRFKIALGFLIVTLIPASIIGFYANYVASNSLLTQEYNNKKELVRNLNHSVESFLGSAEDDVLFLSQSTPMQQYLNQKSIKSVDQTEKLEVLKKQLANEFLAFAQQRRIYYQIRYLDENGQEIVRIDSNKRNTHIVRERKLQNKSTRGYFTNSYELAVGDVYVSSLDLNREHGRIEKPYKPVIRYATPIKYSFGEHSGKPAGIIITNISAAVFLDKIETVALVNNDGFYMAGKADIDLWGGPLDLDTKKSFKADQSVISGEIFGHKSGQLSDSESVYIFSQVNIPGASYKWYLISQDSLSHILTSVVEFRITFISILAASVFIALLIAWIVDSRITRPIEELTKIADKVSKGQITTKVDISDSGEIGELARAFERMRISMVKAFERMKKR